MNHESNGLEPGAASAAPNTPHFAQSAREPYATPRLANFGSFEHITAGTTGGGPGNSINPDEAVFDDGDIV